MDRHYETSRLLCNLSFVCAKNKKNTIAIHMDKKKSLRIWTVFTKDDYTTLFTDSNLIPETSYPD